MSPFHHNTEGIPDGTKAHSEGLSITVVREYVLVAVRGLPPTEEGSYIFRLQIGDQEPFAIDLPVSDITRSPMIPARFTLVDV